jgi:hypothetical protein
MGLMIMAPTQYGKLDVLIGGHSEPAPTIAP